VRPVLAPGEQPQQSAHSPDEPKKEKKDTSLVKNPAHVKTSTQQKKKR
jgi:hypothetical protein